MFIDTLKHFIKSGVRLGEPPDQEILSPICASFRSSGIHPKIFKVLVTNTAGVQDIFCKEDRLLNALIIATGHVVESDQFEANVNVLVEHKADVNKGNPQNGDTPFHSFLKAHHRNAFEPENPLHKKRAQFMKSIGARADIKNKNGDTALDLAKKYIENDSQKVKTWKEFIELMSN